MKPELGLPDRGGLRKAPRVFLLAAPSPAASLALDRHVALLQIASSIRNGPLRALAWANRSPKRSQVSARAASTPIPWASLVQSRSGLPRSSISSAVRPGLAPTLAS